MLPVSFEQMYIRLYWKESLDDPNVTQIKETFSGIDSNYLNMLSVDLVFKPACL